MSCPHSTRPDAAPDRCSLCVQPGGVHRVDAPEPDNVELAIKRVRTTISSRTRRKIGWSL